MPTVKADWSRCPVDMPAADPLGSVTDAAGSENASPVLVVEAGSPAVAKPGSKRVSTLSPSPPPRAGRSTVAFLVRFRGV